MAERGQLGPSPPYATSRPVNKLTTKSFFNDGYAF